MFIFCSFTISTNSGRRIFQVSPLQVTCGAGRYQITLQAFTTNGQGLCAFLTGGEKPHNGGTVVAVPRLKSNAKNENDRTADIWVSAVPHHKDTEAGMPIAKKLAVELNEAISLTVGIHIDHAAPEEIKMLYENCLEAARQFIDEYKKMR
jgi:hypothetical protein